MCRSFLALQPAWSRCRARCLPDLSPSLGVDSRETGQVRQVRRRDGDGIPWLAGERRLAGRDAIGIESVERRRGVGMPKCRRKAQNSAALIIASVDRVRCLKPLLGSRA